MLSPYTVLVKKSQTDEFLEALKLYDALRDLSGTDSHVMVDYEPYLDTYSVVIDTCYAEISATHEGIEINTGTFKSLEHLKNIIHNG